MANRNGPHTRRATLAAPKWYACVGAVALIAGLAPSPAARASDVCSAERDTPQVPTDLALCASLEDAVRRPSALPLDRYEKIFSDYVRNLCHRNAAAGWVSDKHVRDTGPYIATYEDGRWKGKYFGTHAPAFIWYSREMIEWMRANRPAQGPEPRPTAPVPDGAIMVKEMYPAPAAACASIDPIRLRPHEEGAAIMVRDAKASFDGWFWGWFGWEGWKPDWPATSTNYPNMGFGQYCTNCHASARDYTFAALRNVKGEPGHPPVFLSQNFFIDSGVQSHHTMVSPPQPQPDVARAVGPAEPPDNPDFVRTFHFWGGALPVGRVAPMPSETYDNVWVKAGPPTPASQFVTSDQCLGCHSAGGTGLQFDMTSPGPDGKLFNNSPYGLWRGSPMGLAGRDPIFFAQLASETETFHPESSALIQNACLGCHGVLGQRQFAIDRGANGTCEEFSRAAVNATPFSDGDALRNLAHYAALARDGVSCTSCHRMAIGAAESAKVENAPQNACVKERQAYFNPKLSGLARTFTGSFLVGPPNELYGPHENPKKSSMKHALGSEPVHNPNIRSAEICASCHTVHLPVLHKGKTVGHTFEQATYPEWAFSAYRTGATPDGPLPHGAGPKAQTCQDCHMPTKDAAARPHRGKIASIQEYSNFPHAEYTLPPKEIDLEVRTGVSRHVLVGLNVFLVKMAQQFSDILGIRKRDPMLVGKGVDSLDRSEREIYDQAARKTAAIAVDEVRTADGVLSARVTVTNKVGHKFPSGVAFRRAFVAFSVLDRDGKVLWASGRTDGAGVIVDDKGAPVAGELWWEKDCSARIAPLARRHQPHYQTIGRQDQAQIYQELTAAPADTDAPVCGIGAPPSGPLTTSFLSICSRVKDNRLLPSGFLKLAERTQIATAIGADRELAEEVAPVAVGDDPDYVAGGEDSLVYRVPLADIAGTPAAVEATLYYQAIPPFYLQDRFCTSQSEDTRRLFYLAAKLRLDGTPAESWKLKVVGTGRVALP